MIFEFLLKESTSELCSFRLQDLISLTWGEKIMYQLEQQNFLSKENELFKPIYSFCQTKLNVLTFLQ